MAVTGSMLLVNLLGTLGKADLPPSAKTAFGCIPNPFALYPKGVLAARHTVILVSSTAVRVPSTTTMPLSVTK